MITKIQTPSAINAYLQYPLEGTGVQADPFDWYTKATVVDTVSTVTVVEAGDYDSIEKYYNAKLTASQLYTFSISGVDGMSTTATIYYEGTQVAQSVFDDMEWTWGLSYTPSTTGTYLIKISTYSYGGGGTLSVTPVPGEITPWIEKSNGVYASIGFDSLGVSERKYSLRDQRILLPNDLYVSGYNSESALGTDNQDDVGIFILNEYGASLKQLSGKNSTIVAVDQYGRLLAWGNYPGGGSSVPIIIDDKKDWKKVFVGVEKVIALDNEGKLWQVSAWDRVFTEIPFSKRIIKINDRDFSGTANGNYYAIDEEFSLWVWGVNTYGQLGTGNTVTSWSPLKQQGAWKSASFGNYYLLAVKMDGTLWGTGNNDSNQLGLGDQDNRNVLTQIGVLTNWVNVFATETQSFAVNAYGELYSWGQNYWGSLGLGDQVDRSAPVKVGDFNTSIFICGQRSRSFLLFNGTILCSGNGSGHDNVNFDSYSGNVFTPTNITDCFSFTEVLDNSNSPLWGSCFILKRRSV